MSKKTLYAMGGFVLGLLSADLLKKELKKRDKDLKKVVKSLQSQLEETTKKLKKELTEKIKKLEKAQEKKATSKKSK